ncbi:RNA polymerase sigma-70 factor [Parabacteroides sp. AF18-52]|jgi:RNA polymerase sigma factor, sigma-70 family|uniref:RNA polymerase sigma factor n=1 Tax=Parabacteroides TaxID=375288 RepID=UPI000EFFFC49|nr:sigma-70 family RNA polymerase sigma factor [Parabacteroides sp. AF18-52]RHR38691.1 RNA polymerase sigma-70 factor [Parabacteroides sp. AF18-52]
MLSKKEFKLLFDTYFDAIRSFIFYRCGDIDTASDMAQEIFMKVWEKKEQLHKNNLKALLYKIANEMVISAYRKETSRNHFEQEMIYDNESDLSPEDEILFKELASSYARALEQMPEKQRVVFLMSRNDELKYHEIAGRLDISIKTVEKRMNSALQFLKRALLTETKK